MAKLVDARDLKIWAPSLETTGVNGVKFGETSACNDGGNPERSPNNIRERVETWRHPPNLWDFRSTVKRKSRPQMPSMAAAKAVVGKKIPRLHGRAGSIPALGTIFYPYAITLLIDSQVFICTESNRKPVRLQITSL